MDAALRAAVVAASGLLLWAVAAMGLHTAEPWDSPAFWYAYAVAIGVSGAWGYLLPQRAWLWGVIMSFSQAPVMWVTSGEVGSMWLPGAGARRARLPRLAAGGHRGGRVALLGAAPDLSR
uniref:hypothetical protein n=1 Tax=Altererythrobacter segetis TaxID=1104773 RepID=UPI0014080046|nr:hypothetical protein [Altererythrobacter segetis]